MVTHTTTVPAFVRTEAGTVRVEAGAPVPADTPDTEIARLAAAGVIVESAPQDHLDDTDAPQAPPARGRRRGQPGTKKTES